MHWMSRTHAGRSSPGCAIYSVNFVEIFSSTPFFLYQRDVCVTKRFKQKIPNFPHSIQVCSLPVCSLQMSRKCNGGVNIVLCTRLAFWHSKFCLKYPTAFILSCFWIPTNYTISSQPHKLQVHSRFTSEHPGIVCESENLSSLSIHRSDRAPVLCAQSIQLPRATSHLRRCMYGHLLGRALVSLQMCTVVPM